MAISIVQTASAASKNVTLSSPTTAGNCLVVGYLDANGPTSVTGVTLGGSAGNFIQAVAYSGNPSSSDALLAAIWVDPNCAGGQTAVSVTVSANNPGTWVAEISGLVTASVVNVTSNAGGTAGTFSSGSTATTSQASELWVGAVTQGSGTATGPSSPWTNTAAIGEGIFGYQIASSTGTAVYAGTTTSTFFGWGAVVVTLKGAAAVSSSPDIPQINPGPTWFDTFKPGFPRSRPPVPPSGPYYGNQPNPSDVPSITPGTTWFSRFKPGLRRPRTIAPAAPGSPLVQLGVISIAIATPAPGITGAGVGLGVATVTIGTPQISVGESFPLGTAQVAIAALAPSVNAGIGLSPAAVSISTPGVTPVISQLLSPAAVTIGTPEPAVSGVGVALGVVQVTIAVPAVTPAIAGLDFPRILPGPAWLRRFKPGLPRPRPFLPQRVTPGKASPGVATVTIAVPAIKPAYAPVVDLNPATVTITAHPVKISRVLLMSIASQSGQDDYGNDFPEGIQVGPATEPQVTLVPSGGSDAPSQVKFPIPSPALSNVANIAGQVGVSSGTPALEVSGPALETSGEQDWVQLALWANDNDGDSAHLEMRYIDTSGNVTVIGSYSAGGFTTIIGPNGESMFGWSTTTLYPLATGTPDTTATAELVNYIYAILQDIGIIG